MSDNRTCGDGATAEFWADDAARLAADLASPRHRVKSALLLAAAATASGAPDIAAVAAVEGDCARHGLVPLAVLAIRPPAPPAAPAARTA